MIPADAEASREEGWNYCIKSEGLGYEDAVQGVAARVINQKTYLFNKEGKILTGFYYLQGVKRKGGQIWALYG